MLVNSMAPVIGAIDTGLMLTVTLSGILIVFSVLVLLTLIFRLFGVVVDAANGVSAKKEKKAPVPAAPVPVPVKAAPAAAAPAADAGQVSDEIIAVIAAAIAAYDPSSSYSIRSVKRVAASSRPAWNAAGVFDNTRPF